MIPLGMNVRPLAAVVAGIGLDLGCWWWCRDERATALVDGSGLPALVAGLAAALLQVALTWLLLLTVLVALEPLAGRDLTSYAGCPAALRRILLACCGAAAAGALAVPAQAAPVPSDPPEPVVLEGLPLPDRTVDELSPDPPPRRTVLVRHGDTLWALAAARLPDDARPGDVDRAWRTLYATNRSRVGPDPDLIRPGTRLRIPTAPDQEDDR